MNSGNMSDIREVLASIEALNEEADRLNGTDQQRAITLNATVCLILLLLR